MGIMIDPSPIGVLGLILNFGLPLLVGLITRPSWTPQVKGTLLLLVALIKTILEAWVVALSSGVPFNFWAVLTATAVNFILAVGAWFGLLKGTPLAELAKRSLVKDHDLIDDELSRLR